MKNKINQKLKIGLLLTFVVVSFSFVSNFFEIAKQLEIYTTLFKELNVNYIDEINPGDFTEKAIKNTLKNLDPYTNFYNEQDVEDAKIRRAGEYGGIGVSVFYTQEGIVLSKINKGDPADVAGLKAGDIIVKVNDFSLINLEKNILSTQLKGVPNTKVSLEVKRRGKVLNFDLELGKIIVNPVPFFEMIDATTGYIVLTRFNAKASKEVKKAFRALKKRGMTKLVFDLRSNPGGSLFESINIVNFFVPKGSKIVRTKGKIKKNSRTYKGNKNPLDLEIPIVVLVNGSSASASEIVSGALQDYDRAVIMGERSFGKGLVQRYFKLTYGTQLKATISKYYTPSGRCIQELDYANRDTKTSIVPKFSDGTVNAFKTQNGRTVYDGGGVLPDVLINRTKRTAETKKLLKTRAIFNFATNYVSENKTIELDNFSFSTSDFSKFKTYLSTVDTAFVSVSEKLFKTAYISVKENNVVSKEYQRIVRKLKSEKIKEISKNKDVIIELIEDEILQQLFYKKGKYQYHLKSDKTIKEATLLLSNSNKYTQLLSSK